MSERYLEDRYKDEVRYLDAEESKNKIIQEMENEIANALNDIKYGNIFEENNNRVDLYPGPSKYKLQKNQGKNPEDEEFFISEPPQYALNAFKPSGNSARVLGLTSNPRKDESRDLNKDTRSRAFKVNKTLTKIQNQNAKLKSRLLNIKNRLDALKRGLNSTNYKLDTLKSRARETHQRTLKTLGQKVTTSMGGNKSLSRAPKVPDWALSLRKPSGFRAVAVGPEVLNSRKPNGSRLLTKKHRKSVSK